jgi:hypothetical protein
MIGFFKEYVLIFLFVVSSFFVTYGIMTLRKKLEMKICMDGQSLKGAYFVRIVLQRG